MPTYLLQASYTSETWQAQIHHPQNRAEQIRAVIEASGGKLLCFYYAFGENDVVAIAELPDNVSAATLSMVVAAGGAKSHQTTVLMTPEEGLEALRRASGTDYRPPGA